MSSSGFLVKYNFFCQRSECASILDPQVTLAPTLSNLTLTHLKIDRRKGHKIRLQHTRVPTAALCDAIERLSVIRGIPYMTSKQRGKEGGSKKTPILSFNNYLGL